MDNSLLYLELNMGAAGDMLAAALLELVEDPDAALAELNGLGLPGVEFGRRSDTRCGIRGTRFAVRVQGRVEEAAEIGEYEHHHDHGEHEHHHGEHEHHHGEQGQGEHEHRSLSDIRCIIGGLNLPQAVREDALSVFDLLAEAEGAVHGQPVTDIHFHEVGTWDAVADVVAVCWLMHRLDPGRVLASPVCTGFGQVRCAHGLLPVPAPATARLLQGLPVYGGEIRGELCTPTGAALLRHFVRDFVPLPGLTVQRIGYGLGSREFPAANCVRALWGTADTADVADVADADSDTVCELVCNLDDMSGEDVGFAMEVLLASGALEVFTQPCTMKKSRPGVILTVLCRPAERRRMLSLVFRHTTTIGVREAALRRTVLPRRMETVDTPWGSVRKKAVAGCGVRREKWEYDDLARLAREQGMSLAELREALEKENS